MSSVLIEMKDICKSFSKVRVLDHVLFTLNKGEVHALMGENGAGKSTLMKILSGIYQPDSGTITFNGKEVTFSDVKDAEKHGISVIHQELNIIPSLSVMDNMFIGKELSYGHTGVLNSREMKKKTKEALGRLGVHIDPGVTAGDLSVGQQQMIEIAKALETEAQVIIMDEPTAALTDRETNVLFSVIHQLKAEGVSMIYISHRMEELFTVCDRVTVLRDGQFIGTEKVSDTTYNDIVKKMVGRELGEQFPERKAPTKIERIRVCGLRKKGVIEDIDFTVAQGEILGIAGLMGSGRTEMMETLFGSRKKDGGKIFIDQKPVTINKPADAIRTGIGFITEDRKAKGLLLDHSVRENISLPNLNIMSTGGWISKKKESRLVTELIEKLKVKVSDQEQPIKSLSGGNQQKVVLGKWLGTQPKILILDEPTRGVDVGAKQEIYKIMNDLTKQGVSIIMISSELPEVLGMSDRILVMHEGKIAAIMNRAEANQEKIMEAATGGVNAK